MRLGKVRLALGVAAAAVVVAVLGLWVWLRGEEKVTANHFRAEAPLQDPMAEYFRVLKTVCPASAPPPKKTVKIQRLKRDRRRDGAEMVRVSGPDYEMTFESATSMLRRIARIGLSSRIRDQRSARWAVPKNSERKAVRQAVRYVARFAPEMNSLGEPDEVRYFGESYQDSILYGQWKLVWKRRDHGIEFFDDAVYVLWHDEYGFYAYVNEFSSDTCSVSIKLNREQAISQAKDYAVKITKKFPLAFEGLAVGNLKDCSLLIVNPNYLLSPEIKQESPDDFLRFVGKQTRLAWAVGFWCEPVAADLRKVKKKKWIQVWVDAQTGQCLGGDYTM